MIAFRDDQHSFMLDLCLVILSLAVGICLVIVFVGAVLGDTAIGGTVAYLVFTAFGGVIGILASRLSRKSNEEELQAAVRSALMVRRRPEGDSDGST